MRPAPTPYFESIRKDPNQLLPFLREMPKGGDLHNHLSGSIYAESLIQWASDAKDCVNPTTMDLTSAPCGESHQRTGGSSSSGGAF